MEDRSHWSATEIRLAREWDAAQVEHRKQAEKCKKERAERNEEQLRVRLNDIEATAMKQIKHHLELEKRHSKLAERCALIEKAHNKLVKYCLKLEKQLSSGVLIQEDV